MKNFTKKLVQINWPCIIQSLIFLFAITCTLFLWTGCSNMGSWDMIQDQESNSGIGTTTIPDETAPFITSAESNVGENTLTVTFSEPVDSDGGTCDSLLSAANFTYTDTSSGEVTAINGMGADTNACDDNTIEIELNGSTTADDINTDTIAVAANIFDAGSNAASTSAVALIGTNDMIAFYPFNGNCDDKSGNANHLTNTGASLTADRDGNANRAYYFSNKRMDITDTPGNFDLLEELSISVWIYAASNSHSGNNYFYVIGKGGNTAGYAVTISSTSFVHYHIFDNTAADFSTTQGAVWLNDWIHITVTWQRNGKSRTYLNGAMVYQINASANQLSLSGNNQLSIATNPWTNNGNFWGNIDDIRIYDRELSATEISDLYNRAAD
ncbi:MAG: LamG domain-containing protein [bacterium]|nr:LamG domain-containing protein [bacterium]